MKWYVMIWSELIWSEMTMYKNGMKIFKCNDAMTIHSMCVKI